jgi:alkylmercury lyase-like protein
MSDARLAVFELILQTGRVPLVAQVADRLSIAVDDVRTEFRRLQDIHAFALAPASDEILIAHPFSAVPTAYVVRSGGLAFWANCAWDGLAIPAILDADASMDVRCADCGEPIPFTFTRGRLDALTAIVHFAVPPRRFWENVVFT